jgi:hypothetical protein
MDFTPLYEKVYDPDKICPDLLQFLRAAMDALRQEDLVLKHVFESCLDTDKQFYSKRNQGLSYYLFETTLAYVIFKVWLSLGRVEWESSYPHSSEKADLVVFDQIPQNRARWVFEAAWWWNYSRKQIDKLLYDADKLLTWPDADGRILLTFWYGKVDSWPKDSSKIEDVIAHEFNNSVRREYFGAFACDCRDFSNQQCYFGMMALLVLPRESEI